MSELPDLIADVVGIAHEVFQDMEEQVTHVTWLGADGFGAQYPPVLVPRTALVSRKKARVRLPDGTMISYSYKLTFLIPVPPNGAVGRDEPVDPQKDRFVLKDGTEAGIVHVGGLENADTGRPFVLVVYLG
jgi:hypothetical protein